MKIFPKSVRSTTLLYKADVKYMVCDDILYQVDHTLSKTMIARTETRTPARTVWLLSLIHILEVLGSRSKSNGPLSPPCRWRLL